MKFEMMMNCWKLLCHYLRVSTCHS